MKFYVGFFRIAKISSSHSKISFFFFYSVDMMWFDFFSLWKINQSLTKCNWSFLPKLQSA